MKTTKLIVPLFLGAVSATFAQDVTIQTIEADAVPPVPTVPAGPAVRLGKAIAAAPPIEAFEAYDAKLAQPLRWSIRDSGDGIEAIRVSRSRSGPVTYLGVATSPPGPELAAHLSVPQDTGLVVETVSPGSPAEKAGLQQNDVMAKLDDQILIHPRQLAVLVANHKEGDQVKLSVVRKGQTLELSAVLGKQEAGAVGTLEASDDIGIVIDGKVERPLRTFTQRFEIQGDAMKDAKKAVETAHTQALKSMKDLRYFKVAPMPESTEESDKSAREELQKIRQMLEDVTRKLDEGKQ